MSSKMNGSGFGAITYIFILHQAFQYDINFTSKYLTGNEREPTTFTKGNLNHKIAPKDKQKKKGKELKMIPELQLKTKVNFC